MHTHRNRSVWIPIKVTLEPKTKCLKQKYIPKTKNRVLQEISCKKWTVSVSEEKMWRGRMKLLLITLRLRFTCQLLWNETFQRQCFYSFCLWLKSLKWNLVKFCDFATAIQAQSSVNTFARWNVRALGPKAQTFLYPEIKHMHSHVSCSSNCLFDLLALICSVGT